MLALAGGVVFLVTVIGVTVVFNVPLNDALAATPDGSDAQAVLWQGYLDVWTRWNHVRTGGSLLSVGLFALAFRSGIQPG